MVSFCAECGCCTRTDIAREPGKGSIYMFKGYGALAFEEAHLP